MKRIIFTLLAIFASVALFAQAPNAFNYQGIARDLSGNPIINQNIGLRISILQGSIAGTEVYKELHLVSTNNTGLFNIHIGYGTPVNDSIESINWSNGPFFLKIEMDTEGGSNYQLVGTNQLLSVPYALYAENSGNQLELLPPTVVTNDVTILNSSSATLHGLVNGNGFKTDVVFEYDTTTQFVNPIKVEHDPVFGSSDVPVSVNLTGLTSNLTYYFRVEGSNAVGISHGDIMNFTLFMNVPDESVTDVDGNEYETVKIGDQVWMAENLKTTTFRNGDTIPYYSQSSTRGYCWYNHDEEFKDIYGAIYNYYTVNDTRGLCPEGWHIPSLNEWETLINYLGGDSIAGGALKETGTSHWNSPNTGATNSSGFSAISTGGRACSGDFVHLGQTAGFYTSEPLDDGLRRAIILRYDDTKVVLGSLGLPCNSQYVRCIKD